MPDIVAALLRQAEVCTSETWRSSFAAHVLGAVDMVEIPRLATDNFAGLLAFLQEDIDRTLIMDAIASWAHTYGTAGVDAVARQVEQRGGEVLALLRAAGEGESAGTNSLLRGLGD